MAYPRPSYSIVMGSGDPYATGKGDAIPDPSFWTSTLAQPIRLKEGDKNARWQIALRSVKFPWDGSSATGNNTNGNSVIVTCNICTPNNVGSGATEILFLTQPVDEGETPNSSVYRYPLGPSIPLVNVNPGLIDIKDVTLSITESNGTPLPNLINGQVQFSTVWIDFYKV